MYESSAFDTSTPTGLQNKVWFEVMFYFCRHGQGNLRELQTDSFGFEYDASGRRYVSDELTKTEGRTQMLKMVVLCMRGQTILPVSTVF